MALTESTTRASAGFPVLRKLGINETYQLAMYLLNQYRGTILSCRYQIPPRLTSAERRTELERAVTVAVADIVSKHPLLQVAIKDENSKAPKWVQIPQLELREHIQWLYLTDSGETLAKEVQRVFADQLDEMFPDFEKFQPGWKMTLIRQGSDSHELEVLLTWNHPQFDGAGARILHEDFLTSLNSILYSCGNENGSVAHNRPGLDLTTQTLNIPSAPPPNLLNPLETLAKLPVDIKHLLRTVYEELRPPFLSRDLSFARWCPIRSDVRFKTQFRCFEVPTDTLATLLARCRANKTTITGLINGLALVAFARHLSVKQAPAFQSSTVMDHRRNLPAGSADGPWGARERAVANYVTQLPHKHDAATVAWVRGLLSVSTGTAGDGDGVVDEDVVLSPELVSEVWSISARSRREIEAQLELGLKNDIVGIFKFVGDWQATMKDMAKRPRQFSWLVTNIGVLHGRGKVTGDGGDDRGNGGMRAEEMWSITRAQFGLSAETPAAAIEFSPVSVAGGGMVVGANWHDPALDAKLGERIVGDLERWLHQLGKVDEHISS